MRKFNDLENQKPNRINLNPAKKKQKRQQEKTLKKRSPLPKIQDLHPPNETKFLYIHGKKFTPPKHLSSLIRLASLGFILLFAIISTNVYVQGRSLQQEIQATAQQGIDYLIEAGKDTGQIEITSAKDSLQNALNNFTTAQDDLWFLSRDTSIYTNANNTSTAVTSLLDSGQHFSRAGQHFLFALEEFNKIPLYFVSKNNPLTPEPPSITETLKDGLKKTELAISEITQATEKISKIDESTLPPEIAGRITFAKSKIDETENLLQETASHFPALLKLLGDEHPHRFLILQQNNDEIRPSGGFIGSYTIIDINDGYIEKIDVQDVYDLDGRYGGIIEPPDDYKLFTTNWRFRDSNYSHHFPLTAEKAKWFLEKQGGPSVDTVIAINQGLLRDMLQITGPVQVGEFGELTADNYNLLLTYVIEGKVWGAENPKHILKVFIPAFRDAILKEENLSKILSKLYKAVQQKHIMVYSSDPEIEEVVRLLGLSGEIHQPQEDEDYLSVIHISKGGSKSEKFIQEEILHHTDISEDGTVTNTITLKRTHVWSDDLIQQWRQVLRQYNFTELPEYIINILGRGDNNVITKIYVPKDSTLISTTDPELTTKFDEELNQTYFRTQSSTIVGQPSEITFTYELPFKLNNSPTDTYRLFINKQPGSRGSILNKTLDFLGDQVLIDNFPETVEQRNGLLTLPTNLVYDRYMSVLFSE